MTTDIKDKILIRDVLGSAIPQYFNEELKQYVVETLDGSIVTSADYNFRKTRLLRDKLGSPIEQLWDATNEKWVAKTSQSGAGGGSNINVIDNLTSTSSADALSANMGNTLNNNLTSLDDRVTQHLDENNAYETTDLLNGWSGTIKFKKNAHNLVDLTVVVNGGVKTHGTQIALLPMHVRPNSFKNLVAITMSGAANDNTAISLTIADSGVLLIEGTAKDYIQMSTVYEASEVTGNE